MVQNHQVSDVIMYHESNVDLNTTIIPIADLESVQCGPGKRCTSLWWGPATMFWLVDYWCSQFLSRDLRTIHFLEERRDFLTLQSRHLCQ